MVSLNIKEYQDNHWGEVTEVGVFCLDTKTVGDVGLPRHVGFAPLDTPTLSP